MTLLFENDTSAIVKKLADRSLKADKRRNAFIIVAITFAICLMTVLGLYSFGKSYELKTFLQGRYQAVVVNTDLDTISTLSRDETIEMIGTEVDISTIRVSDYTLDINYRDSNDLCLRSMDLSGRLPEMEYETAVSSSYLEHIGRPATLGQKVSLPLKNGFEEEYTVCGIVNDDGSNRIYQVMVSEAFLHEYYTDDIPYVGIFRIAGSEAFSREEVKAIIIGCMDDYGISEEKIAFSSSYFDSLDNSSRDTLVVLAVSILVVIACSMVIYSLFYISVVGKIREYGRLRVIGMTRKQIRRMVWREGRKLSVISILAGIFLGSILGYALVPKGWYWPNSILCMAGASLLAECAVIFSVRKPVKIASEASPVEAVRATAAGNQERVRGRERSPRRLSPANLAVIHFLRNKKKTALTLCSLGFTGMLLMCGATYFSSVDADNVARQMFGDQEIAVSLTADNVNTQQSSYVEMMERLQENNPLSEALIDELFKCREITEIKVLKGILASVFLPGDSGAEGSIDEMIYGLSREQIKERQPRLLGGTMDYDTLVQEHGILVDETAKMLLKFYGYDVALGDSIEVISDTGEKIVFTVAGLVDFGKEYQGDRFFVPIECLQELRGGVSNFNTRLLIRSDVQSLSTAEQFVFEALSGNQGINIETYSDALAFSEKNLKVYKAPIYGLVLFIALFGIVNLINTLMTNLVSRQREFGVLQSIGLSGKQLARMLRLESFCYVLGTMVITLTIGTAAGYFLCVAFDQIGVFGKLNYTFPVAEVTVFFAALTAITAIYAVLAIRYCRKQSLVDWIKTID